MKNFKVLFLLIVCILSIQTLHSQSQQINGVINDASTGESLVGVTVVERGTQNGSVSDLDGRYTITVSSDSSQLEFSYIGFQNMIVEVGRSTTHNIQLKTSTVSLDDVVIVAYGSAPKRELTGAVTQVKVENVETNAYTSIDLALQGEVPGLQIVSSSGQPGAEATVRLRGIGSISAGSDPLYVVDGIPINSGFLGNRGFTWSSNSLAGINAADIESISILKDASATSLYGSRGGNGVILITTQKGRAGKTRFNFSTNLGVNKVGLGKNIPRPLNAEEYEELTNEGLLNAGFTQADADLVLDGLGANDSVDTDWFDLVTRNGFQQSYNLSASGGSETTQFYISGGYFKQEGSTIGAEFDRISGSFSLSHQATDKLSLQTNLVVSSAKQTTPFQSAFFASPILAANFLNPFQDPYDEDGEANINPADFPQTFNPIAVQEYSNTFFKNKKFIGSAGFTYRIIDGLNYSFRAGVDLNQTNESVYYSPIYGNGATIGGYAAENVNDLSNWNVLNLLTYQTELLSDNSLMLRAKAGFEVQESNLKQVGTETTGFPPNVDIQTLSAGGTPISSSSSLADYTFQSILSDITLVYRTKYTLSASLRRDGSSRFGSNNRHGVFYSIGGSWYLKEENFLKDVEIISSLRIRSSYGKTGNADIPNYAWRPTYGYGFNYNGAPGSAPTNAGNPDLTWEKSNAFNIGIDGGILNDRIFLTADYYIRKTTDLLLDVPVSLTTGFETTLENVGEMENKGIEIGIVAYPLQNRKVDWRLQFNIAHNKNKVLKLYQGQDIISSRNIISEGEDFQSFYLAEWVGVNSETGEPLWYVDSSRAETTSDYSLAAKAIVGTVAPDFYGSFTNTLSWNGFELMLQINYSIGGQLYDQWASILQSDGFLGNVNKLDLQLDRWQQPGDEAAAPQYIWGNPSGSNFSSTRFLYESDYIRLRNVRLAYDFPSLILDKMHLNNLRVYVEASNLWTWVKDDRVYFDPDLTGTRDSFDGISDLSLPVNRTISAGLNIGF